MKKVRETELYEEWTHGDSATFWTLTIVLPMVAVATILTISGQTESFVELVGSAIVWMK